MLLFISLVHSKKAMLSFDEGPAAYTKEIIDTLKRFKTNATFFFDPNKEISTDLIKSLINENHSIGISFPEEVEEMNTIKEQINLFITKTGFKPKLARLSRYGFKEKIVELLKELDIKVTKPTIDSEDIERVNFVPFLLQAIKEDSSKYLDVSIVLRDRFSYTSKAIETILHCLFHEEYTVVNSSAYFSSCFKPVEAEPYELEKDKSISVKEEIINKIKNDIKSKVDDKTVEENSSSESTSSETVEQQGVKVQMKTKSQPLSESSKAANSCMKISSLSISIMIFSVLLFY